MQIGNKAPLFIHSHLYGVSTYGGEDAESLLGKTLIFTADKASCFGDKPSYIKKVATNPVYT